VAVEFEGRMMTEQLNETVEGVLDEFGATRVRAGSFPHVSVWDSDGDSLFTLPVDATTEDVNRCIRIYLEGFKRGESHGELIAQHAMRKALGIG
jgi:hypothetical protein